MPVSHAQKIGQWQSKVSVSSGGDRHNRASAQRRLIMNATLSSHDLIMASLAAVRARQEARTAARGLIEVRVEKDFSTAGPNYIRNSDIAPYIEDDALVVFEGRSGRHISVRSDVYAVAPDVIAVEVTGWHKFAAHGPAGGTYYFVRDAKSGE